MTIDPPAEHYPETTTPDPSTPHPFEIALIRKVEAKTRSVRDAFLLLDVDGDGRVSPDDIRTVLHNEFGMDMTEEQERFIFSRFSGNDKATVDGCEKAKIGMTFGEFAKYFNDMSNATTLTSSEAGLAAAVGFYKQESIGHELSIHQTPETILRQLRHQLRQALMTHSSRTHGGSGMKETSLYLAIDVHRSGKVTMQELLDWLKSVGIEWDTEQLKLVVLGCHAGEDGKKMEKHFFGTDDSGLQEGGKEAGMTEHEFAEFVESLNDGTPRDDVTTKIVAKEHLKEPQDKNAVLKFD